MDGIRFDKPPAIYWSVATKMSYIQRRIIVYSLMYYRHNESCVSDRYYDCISHQLVAMRKEFPEQYKQTRYYYAMYDFEGSTGFDIPSRLNTEDWQHLERIATIVHKQWRQQTGGRCLV